jgi:hypothetical protein
MKTTLTLITIITSLFFSACANNNRAEYSNARRAANASFQAEQLTRLQKDLILDQFTRTWLPVNDFTGAGVSSARFKKDIKPMDKASEAILALKPVTFHYKKELDPEGIPQFGLVAEDVAKVNADLVARDAQGKVFTVRYEAVNAMLLNEFLKEHRKVQEQDRKLERQEATIAKQQKQIEALTTGLQKVSDQLEVMKPAPQIVVSP